MNQIYLSSLKIELTKLELLIWLIWKKLKNQLSFSLSWWINLVELDVQKSFFFKKNFQTNLL